MVLTALPASAQTDVTVYTSDDNPGGAAWFKGEGEHFGICDRQNDSLGVRGQLTWTAGGVKQTRTLWHHTGHWPDRPDLSCDEFTTDISIVEGTKITLQVCLQEEKGAPLRFCKTATAIA